MPRFSIGPDGAPEYLTPRRVLEACRDGSVLLDIRESHETNYRVFDVPATILVPFSEFKERQGELPRDASLIVADAVGIRAKAMARFLLENGYPDVAWMAGGIVDWVRDGLPIRKDSNYELRGQCGCKMRPRDATKPPSRK